MNGKNYFFKKLLTLKWSSYKRAVLLSYAIVEIIFVCLPCLFLYLSSKNVSLIDLFFSICAFLIPVTLVGYAMAESAGSRIKTSIKPTFFMVFSSLVLGSLFFMLFQTAFYGVKGADFGYLSFQLFIIWVSIIIIVGIIPAFIAALLFIRLSLTLSMGSDSPLSQ